MFKKSVFSKRFKVEPTTNSSLPQPTPSTWKSMKWHRMRNMGNDETYIWKTTVVFLVNFSGVVKCSKEVKEAQNAAIISDNAVRILPHLVAYNVKNTFVKKLGSVSKYFETQTRIQCLVSAMTLSTFQKKWYSEPSLDFRWGRILLWKNNWIG